MDRTKKGHLRHHVDRLREQFAQSEPGPLSQVLASREMQQILSEEMGRWRERVYPPAVTLRLFIDQVLSTDSACQDAVVGACRG